MSEKMAIQINVRYYYSLFIGSFWAIKAIFSILFRFLKHPTEKFSFVVRKERPVCLESTENWTHHSLQLDDIKLHYVAAGAPHKPLMIFVHGFPETWFSWRHQLKYFKKDYRVIAVSLRGYGDSDAPIGVDKYTIPILVEDIRGLLNSLESTGAKDCVLVGHDLGGTLCWYIASNFPEMVKRLIILNCPHGGAFQEYMRSSRKQFLMSGYMFFFQWPWLPEFYMTRNDLAFLRDIMKQYNADDDDIAAHMYYFSQKGAFTGPINFYRAVIRHGLSPHFPTLNMPVIIIWGTDDTALDEPLAAMSAEYCSDVRIKKIQGGNHFIQQHKPDLVNEFMEQFLSGNKN